MKKYFLFIAAFFCLMLTNAQADFRKIPEGPSGQLETSDYGGVDYSTISFSTSAVLCFTGEGVVHGAIISSNSVSTDKLLFFATGTLVGAKDTLSNSQAFMVVNLSTTNLSDTNKIGYYDQETRFVKFPHPIRVRYTGPPTTDTSQAVAGLAVRCTSATIEKIVILWSKLNN